VSDRQVVHSKVVKVTVFEDRAEVTRTAVVRVAAGSISVAIDGVSAVVDDPSIVARPKAPGVRVTSSRVIRRMRDEAGASESEIAAIEGDLERARTHRRQAQHALARAEAERIRVQSLESAWVNAVAKVPRSTEESPNPWQQSLAVMDRALSQALDDGNGAALAVSAATLEVQRAESRLEIARRTQPRLETRVELDLEVPEPMSELAIELVYRVPCALWRPEHHASLEGKAVKLRTYATVWQATGEVWADVPLAFSTARPARAASPPLLSEDVLSMRKKTEQEKKVVVVEARDQVIQKTGAEGARAVEEMPGVDDGGEPLLFHAKRPATIASDGAPMRVEIGEAEMPVIVDRVAMPELSPVVHVRARGTHRAPTPLLAGPVVLVRNGTLVGKSRLGFIGPGEPVDIGFGPDDGVRVRRTRTEKRETVPIIGTQKVTRTITVFVSNTSAEHRSIVVIERYPVSEIGDVDIELVKHAGALLEKNDGMAKYELELEPRSTRELVLVYRIDAASKVQLRV